MSGHSKWKTIKRQKGAADAKRGQAFTKMANAIIMCVRQSSNGDPSQNFKLRLLVDKARAINMPKDNIERAIERGLGKGDKGTFDEVVYEGFAPGGVSVIVEAVTDNKMRTTPEVKNVFDKNGGSMGTPGSAAYQFQKKGYICVKKENKTIDDIFLIAADAGAEDIEDAGDEVHIYTNPDALSKVREALMSQGIAIEDAELQRKPTLLVHITDKEMAERVLSFMEKLEDMDDVQKVYANYDISDEIDFH